MKAKGLFVNQKNNLSLSFFYFYFYSNKGSRLGGMKREPGENPGHYPMLLAPLKAFLLPQLPLSLIWAGRPRKSGVSQKTCL